MRTVGEIMTPVVQAIHQDKSILETEGVFVTQSISGAPIMDDLGTIVGFVSRTESSVLTPPGKTQPMRE